MQIGTRSLLFGAHQFLLHPLFVALAWWKLYSFPLDPRLWVAFVVHDWGYWGSPEMDGLVGDMHPHLGARIMRRLFGEEWHYLCLYHSRFLAKMDDALPSRLCMADKLALVFEPWWLYLPRVWLSGELNTYMRSAEPDGKHGYENLQTVTARKWYASVQNYLRWYVYEHRDGKRDTVTQAGKDRFTSGDNGVWL